MMESDDRHEHNILVFPTLEAAIDQAQGLLANFVNDISLSSKIDLVFGTQVDSSAAKSLITELAREDSTALPKIEIRSELEINGANGAFAGQNYTIYLSRQFIEENAGNLPAITAVLLEEIGHAIDFRLNASDTLGDEGELFADLVRGVALSEGELQRIKTEDDSAVVTIDGNQLQIEQGNYNLGLVEGTETWNHSIFYGDQDYFVFQISGTGKSDNLVGVASESESVDLILELYNQSGNLLLQSDENDETYNLEAVYLTGLPAGTYVAKVYDYYGGQYVRPYSASYTLGINGPTAPQIPQDDYEPNNSLNQAKLVTSGTSYDINNNQIYIFEDLSIHSSSDTDYFKFTIDTYATEEHFILTLVNSTTGDIDLNLYNNSGTKIYTTYVTASGAGVNYIPLEGLSLGTYYLQAGSYEGELTDDYSLGFSLPKAIIGDSYERNDGNENLDTAENLGTISGFKRVGNLSIHSSNDLDVFKFTTTKQATSQNYVKIDFDNSQGNLDLLLIGGEEDEEELINSSATDLDGEVISLQGLPAGTYYVAVASLQKETNSYSLSINAPGDTTSFSDDIFESNNSKSADLKDPRYGWTKGTGFYAWEYLSISSNDQDWFELELDEEAVSGHYVAIAFDNSQGDLDLELYNSSSSTTPIRKSYGFRDYEFISLDGLDSGTYHVKVLGYQSATNPSATNPNYTLFVNTPGSDIFEDNDTKDNPKDLTPLRRTYKQSWENLSIDDDDWFKFNLPMDSQWYDYVQIDFDDSLGDLDLALYQKRNNSVVKVESSTGSGNTERIFLEELERGDYLIKVYGYDGDTNPNYTLTINAPVSNKEDSFEPNDDRNHATDLEDQLQPLQQGRQTVTLGSDPSKPLSIDNHADVDWFKFTLASTGQAGDYAEITLDHKNGDLDLYLYDSLTATTPKLKSEGVANVHRIDFKDLQPDETYYLKVSNYGNGVMKPPQQSYGNYVLTVSAPFKTSAGDWSGKNNTYQQAKDLGKINRTFKQGNLAITSGDIDWFKFEIADKGSKDHSVGINFKHRQGDLDIELYKSDGKTWLDSSEGVSGVEEISLANRSAGVYYLKVYGYDEDTNNPEYELFINAPEDTTGDWAEANNTKTTAFDLREVVGDVEKVH